MRIWHGNGKRYETRPRFDVSDRETNVFAPYVDDRSASAVIAGIHAKIILLVETGAQRKHPIRPLLIRAALVGPERGSSGCGNCRQRILMVGPAANCESNRAGVSVFNIKDGNRREVGIYRDG